jgi:hypothetical protein
MWCPLSGSVVRVRRSSRPVSTRPASSRLLSAPVGPDASVSSHRRRWRWGPGRGGGQPTSRERVEVPVGCHVLERLDRRPSRPGRGRRCRGRTLVSRGVGGGPGPGVGGQRQPRVPAEQPGRPGRRASAVAYGCAVGTGAGCSARLPRRPPRGRRGPGGDHGAWSSWCLLPGWTSPEDPVGVPAGMACGPSAAQAGSQRSRLAAGSALTCGYGLWACQDLNLGPHPDRKRPPWVGRWQPASVEVDVRAGLGAVVGQAAGVRVTV